MIHNKSVLYTLYAIRKLARKLKILQYPKFDDTSNVDYFDAEANNYIYEILASGKPCMISKFGTTELNTILTYLNYDKALSAGKLRDFFKGEINLSKEVINRMLGRLSGFFPVNTENIEEFVNLQLSIVPEIDVLASYISSESHLNIYFSKACKRVNLNGYYAPFLWEKPWSRILEDKKVLVVHPFTESIRYQYDNNRDKLFDNPLVLPKFKEFKTIKAIQSLGGENDDFDNWFEALEYMKVQIANTDFDIALIGCGAYGMPLAAYVKQLGKQAVHLAGWTQMLFGVYGKRWLDDQPEFSRFINDSWIRPRKDETPKSADRVEGGCYW